MKREMAWWLLPSVLFAACTTNTTVVQGGKGGGAACDADDECTSGRCNGATGGTSSGSSSGEGENGASPESGGVSLQGTCAAPASSSSSGGSDGGGGSGADAGGIKCGESGMYCKSNVLRSCATDAVVEDCATCKYVGPGTGSEYDTSCRDEASDCTTCDSERPWTGPGCYFGGGPAVCK